MQSKLSDLVDNLSEINKKECPECIKRKIKSECEFTGFKNDRLHYRCKKCIKRCIKCVKRWINQKVSAHI